MKFAPIFSKLFCSFFCVIFASHFYLFSTVILAQDINTNDQTDWTGGASENPDTPVPDWLNQFSNSDQLSWRAIAGQIALSSRNWRDVPIRNVIVKYASRPKTIAIEDIDGDMLDDIISSDPVYDIYNNKGSVLWWKRTPSGSWKYIIVDDDFHGAYHVSSADVDRDGDTDILCAAYYGPDEPNNRNGRYAWFENLDGAGTKWKKYVVGEYYWGASWIDSGDFDTDGDIDLVGASYLTGGGSVQDGDIVWFENLDGEGTIWTDHALDNDFPGAGEAHAADLDGDNDMDIVGTYSDPESTSRFAWWENIYGDGTVWEKHWIPGDYWGQGHLDVGDIDNDGDLDLIGGGLLTGSIGYWENRDGTGEVWYIWSVTGLPYVYCYELADLDGDGDLDALMANYGQSYPDSTWSLENQDGLGRFWKIRKIRFSELQEPWIRAGDIDNDGKLDVVISDLGSFPLHNDQLTWYDMTEFDSVGNITSSILDGGNNPNWQSVTWDTNIPDNASLKVKLRASDDYTIMGDYVTVDNNGQLLEGLINPNLRYLQYKLELSRDGQPVSPVVYEVGINDLHLDNITPAIAGQNNSLTAYWPVAGDRVFYAFSIQRGYSSVPGCPDIKLELIKPKIAGSSLVDHNGLSTLNVFVPGIAKGLGVFIQAVEPKTCTVSNLIYQKFQ